MKFKTLTVGAVLMHKNGIPNEEKPKKKWMGSKPVDCDICSKPFEEYEWFVDGKTMMGPWGLLCPICFRSYGVGLGTGKGQKYNLETLEKIDG